MENDNTELTQCPLGERALLCTLSQEITKETNDKVLLFSEKIKELQIPGVISVQPAYTSLAIHFDPGVLDLMDLAQLTTQIYATLKTQGLENGLSQKKHQRIVEIPVVYGGEEGPDLKWAEQYLGLSAEEIVKRHSQRLYPVYMIGFTPGFPYLGGLDETIAMPRLPQPRTKVPKGSVGIAGNQTGIYSLETPGGWRIIGRTPVELFSPFRDPPSLLEPGDLVKFVPIGKEVAPDTTFPQRTLDRASDDQNTKEQETSRSFSLPCFEVLEPGFHSILVDDGRKGYEAYGVPVSGAVDARSYHLGNHLCANRPDEAAIEFALKGPALRALANVVVCVTGALAQVTVNGQGAPMYQPFFVKKDSILKVGDLSYGLRGYLTVRGGFFAPHVLSSKSTYVPGSFGGFRGRTLKPGDVLERTISSQEPSSIYKRLSQENLRFFRLNFSQPLVRIIPGPECSADAIRLLTSQPYTVSPSSDRMGLRLTGLKLLDQDANIISSPVVPGTIQVTPDGTPIILLQDGQTTGGYRRVAVAVEEDLSILGQVRPGTKLRFKMAFSSKTQWAKLKKP